MKQQKTEVETSAKAKDDRIKQLKVCTHMPYIAMEVINLINLMLINYC